jgi:hypothetical protein
MPVASLHLSPAELTSELAAALKTTLFASNLRINPRRLQGIAADTTAAYLSFVAGELRDADANGYGRRLAGEGLGHAGLLALVATLLRSAWGSGPEDGAVHPAITYTGALLAGYMAAREEALLQEQERTRVALDRARAQQ